MEGQEAPAEDAAASWDLLADELSRLRLRVGNPSFDKVAQLVTDRRSAQGAEPHVARVARTTVYDCFRTGRRRVNVPLVREIALALGATDAHVDDWLLRCHGTALAKTTEGDIEFQPASVQQIEPPPLRKVALLLAACIGLNLVGRFLVDVLHLPGYMDMVGTAIAAVAVGPWRGALVGSATNVLGVISSGIASLYFIPVNIIGALVWGYGVHRYDMGRSLQRYLLLCMATGLACTATAVPILYVVFGGFNGNGTDFITQTVRDMTGSSLVGILTSNTLVSQADKLVSGFVALVIVLSLPANLRWCRDLVLTAPESNRKPSLSRQ
ncbi:ECF transporter S component [Nocardioides sambongensis]|uniref:ECF transporter S component n=1 Tax=Nocardioides sambongensis TaxID=2589074 RepID=UPI0011290B8F|nr:ECF transporter S component [Nocardioides sambongensis]